MKKENGADVVDLGELFERVVHLKNQVHCRTFIAEPPNSPFFHESQLNPEAVRGKSNDFDKSASEEVSKASAIRTNAWLRQVYGLQHPAAACRARFQGHARQDPPGTASLLGSTIPKAAAPPPNHRSAAIRTRR